MCLIMTMIAIVLSTMMEKSSPTAIPFLKNINGSDFDNQIKIILAIYDHNPFALKRCRTLFKNASLLNWLSGI